MLGAFNADLWFNGKIGEHFAYSKAVSLTEEAQALSYMNAKWIAAVPPSEDKLLLETGDALLLETGDALLLE